MTSAAITIVGLGLASIKELTLEAHSLLAQAAQRAQTVHFRTLTYPILEPLQQEFPGLQITSFDRLYDESKSWGTLYQRIAEFLCDLAAQQPVIYAVPGHPLIGEASVQIILRQAHERGLRTVIVAGLSYIEPVCTLLNLDPFDTGTQIVDATNLATLRPDEVGGKVLPTVPLLVVQVYNQHLASSLKLALSECYPDDWPVKLIRIAGTDAEANVLEMPLCELDRNSFVTYPSTLYVPPMGEMSAHRLPETLRSIIVRLRREPDGCPWDLQQTHQSLTNHVLDEAYEVVEALEENNTEKLAEELGDLLFQVYMHAEIARQSGEFAIGDVFKHINTKLIRRHPHIFGLAQANDAEEAADVWEVIKSQERAKAGKDLGRQSVLDNVPQRMPALTIGQEYQKSVMETGFDSSNFESLYRKVPKDLQELQQIASNEERREEFGNLLFMLTNWAIWLHIDAEEALRLANRRFRKRFQKMEVLARKEGRELTSYTSEEWRVLWEQVKVQE